MLQVRCWWDEYEHQQTECVSESMSVLNSYLGFSPSCTLLNSHDSKVSIISFSRWEKVGIERLGGLPKPHSLQVAVTGYKPIFSGPKLFSFDTLSRKEFDLSCAGD